MERSIHSAKYIFVENLYRRYGILFSTLFSLLNYMKKKRNNQPMISLVIFIWAACAFGQLFAGVAECFAVHW